MIAHLRQIRISSTKANLVAGMIRRKPVNEALFILEHTPKKAAKLLYKVVQSAAANAENNFKQDRDTLVIKEILVTEGTTYKRSQPVSRGRSHPILKRTTHITVKVEAAVDSAERNEKKKKSMKKSEVKQGSLKSEDKSSPKAPAKSKK